MYHDTGFKTVSPGWRIWGGEGKTEGGEGGAVECNSSGLGRKSGFLTRTWLEVTSGCFAVQKGSLHMHLQDHVLQTVTANSRDLSAPCTPPALQRYLPPSSPQVEVHGCIQEGPWFTSVVAGIAVPWLTSNMVPGGPHPARTMLWSCVHPSPQESNLLPSSHWYC